MHAIVKQVQHCCCYFINLLCCTIKWLAKTLIHTCNMKPHEQLFLSRNIAMGQDGVEKVLNYLADYLPATFSHPAKQWMMVTCCHFCMVFYKFIWSFGMLQVLFKSTSLILQEHQDTFKTSVQT